MGCTCLSMTKDKRELFKVAVHLEQLPFFRSVTFLKLLSFQHTAALRAYMCLYGRLADGGMEAGN